MNEKKNKYAVFTMDVEDFTDTECVRHSNAKGLPNMLDGLDEYIRFLEGYHIKATLFTVCKTVSSVKDRLKGYLARGHKLALHGYEHIAPQRMTDEQFRMDTERAKRFLEDTFQTEVSGYRAPCFSMNNSKLSILRELGFRYDSSKMGFKKAYYHTELDLNGYQKPLSNVYESNGFYEFSLPSQKFLCFNFPVSGGGYVRIGRWSFGIPMVHHYIRSNDYYVFYLHPFEFSKFKTPKIKDINIFKRFYLSYGIRNYRRKIAAIIKMLQRNGYQFVTFDELSDALANES